MKHVNWILIVPLDEAHTFFPKKFRDIQAMTKELMGAWLMAYFLNYQILSLKDHPTQCDSQYNERSSGNVAYRAWLPYSLIWRIHYLIGLGSSSRTTSAAQKILPEAEEPLKNLKVAFLEHTPDKLQKQHEYFVKRMSALYNERAETRIIEENFTPVPWGTVLERLEALKNARVGLFPIDGTLSLSWLQSKGRTMTRLRG